MNLLPTSGSLPEPFCKTILALLTPVPEWEPALCADLEGAFGSFDYRGKFFHFDVTDYYAAEMGNPLYRAIGSFQGLGSPQDLVEWKWRARVLEGRWSRNGLRLRNFDIGYLDADKLVLASFKRGPCKLYLGKGVWGDMIMGYSKGGFSPTGWAFADFREGRYNGSLMTIREKMKAGMRK